MTSGKPAETDLQALSRTFDSYCQAHGIDYFAIEDTLIGAVTYADFIPESSMIHLGMLRAPFESLRKLASTTGRLICAGLDPLKLSCEFGKTVKWHVTFAAENPANEEAGQAIAQIHVFDAVTDDFNLTTWQRFREEMWGKLRKKAPAALRPGIERHVDGLARLYEDTPHDEVSLMLERRRRRYPLSHLQHPRRIPFGTGSICIPNDTRSWVESDKAAEADRVKRVQHDSLLILQEVDRVCKNNGIGYFLCAGTLLGALRYRGFIPWDDDIDLGMLREDYERFLECAPRELGDRFFLQNRRTDKDVEYLFSKVRLKDTEYVTDWTRFRNQDKGISIDIFPFDRAAVESAAFEEHARKADELVKANRYVAWHRVTEDFPHRMARNPMEAFGHVVMDRRNRPFDAAALEKTQSEYEAHVTRFNDDPAADYAVSYVTYLTYLPLRDLLPYSEIEFEGQMYPAPLHPESLMRMQFGDFMKEPPPHQRHAHAVISWRTSDGHSG